MGASLPRMSGGRIFPNPFPRLPMNYPIGRLDTVAAPTNPIVFEVELAPEDVVRQALDLIARPRFSTITPQYREWLDQPPLRSPLAIAVRFGLFGDHDALATSMALGNLSRRLR
jgi:hypothetical protein